MSGITTHVLDTALGRPADGVPIRLEAERSDGGWDLLGEGVTDADGRLRTLMPPGRSLSPGRYRLVFDLDRYAVDRGRPSFFPEVIVTFRTAPGEERYHVPLLVSPFGYSTYRGS